ncbi:ferric/cupric-chelate reductase [Aphanomyces cochlioides]|nr:ferric/cupric-chelate reductase [Aphanomyces cochlioides]
MYSSASITAPVCVKRATALPAQVVQLTLHCTTGYTPGDVVWIKVPAPSNTQWHPFSFSVASTLVHTPGLHTVYIKYLGKWSNNLYHYIRQCEKDNVDPIVDMNGGYTPAPAIPSKHSDVVFVGGGIGVTLLMGQLVHILHTHPNQTVWLIWHVRGSNMLLHNTLINCFRNVVVPNVLQSVQDCFTACAGSVYHSHTMTAPYMLAKNAI